MSFVLVDAPSVEATLVASGDPRPVQIVVNGVSTGQSVTVVAVAGGAESSVPGGVIVSAPGGQIVLVDNRAPLNTPVYYSVLIDGQTYVSNEVTISYPGQQVMQSLDGRTVVDFVWMENGLPQEPLVRAAAFNVPGRRRPPVRFAAGGAGGGSVVIRTTREHSNGVRALLESGRPVVVRTDGRVRDFPAAELVLPTGGSSVLWDALAPSGDEMSSDRVWSIPYLLVDDPEPGVALSAFTWDDFDLAMTGRTWDDFDGIFAASTWDEFDTYDWSQLL